MSLDLGIEGLTEVETIGRGGFSVVYSARDTRFDRRVAVKVLNKNIDDADRRRFERECRIMGRLSSHPNVVVVYDAGYAGNGSPYLMMELIEGGSLADLLAARGPLPWREAVAMLQPIADALARAHAENILHRDVKPENILVADGVPRLTDFGIAYLRDSTGSTSTHVSASWLHTPPETFDDNRDERSDLYSLASTLFTLVTGHEPFWRPNEQSINPLLSRLLNEEPPALSPEQGPPALSGFLQRALAKDPAVRPQTAAEFRSDLEAVLAGEASAAWTRPLAESPTGTLPTPGSAPAPGHAPTATPPTGIVSAPAAAPIDEHAAPRVRRRPVAIGAGLLAVVALAGGGLAVALGRQAAEGPPDGGPADQAEVVAGPTASTLVETAAIEAELTIEADKARFNTVVALDDGGYALGSADGTLLLFGPARAPEPLLEFRDPSHSIATLLQLADGSVVTAGAGDDVLLWDRRLSGSEAVVFDGHTAGVEALVQLDGERFASAGADGTIRLWDASFSVFDGLVLTGHEGPVLELISVADGRLVSGGADGSVRIWDPEEPNDPTRTLALDGHTGAVTDVALLSDGRVVSGAEGGTVRVWDLARPATPLTFDAGAGIVDLVVMSDDRVLAATSGGLVLVWSVDDEDDPVTVSTPAAVTAAVALDGGRVALGGDDGRIWLWDPGVAGSTLLDGHVAAVVDLAVRTDGSLVSVAADGTARLWVLDDF